MKEEPQPPEIKHQPHEEYSLPGWPGRVSFMPSAKGTRIFQFVPGDTTRELRINQFFRVNVPGDRNRNPLNGKTEIGRFISDGKEYGPGLTPVLTSEKTRAANCLIGKGEANFAGVPPTLLDIVKLLHRPEKKQSTITT